MDLLRNRQPAGAPVGGQFSTTARNEPELTLTGATSPGGADPARAAAAAEMESLHSRHIHSQDPFWRGFGTGALAASQHLAAPAGDADTFRQLAAEAFQRSIEQDDLATSGGPATKADLHANLAEKHLGEAHALLFAAHRVTDPQMVSRWALIRAQDDVRQMRQAATAPEPVSFWTSMRRSLRRGTSKR